MHRNPSCPSCSHSFTITDSSHVHNTKQPMLLQCGHSCCENCLLKATRTNKENVKCVVCKAVTDLSLAGKGIKSLSPDIFVNGVLHLNRKSLLEIELQRLMPAGSASQKPKQDLVLGGYMKSKICCECMKRYASCRCTKCDCIVCGTCFDKIHHLFKTLRHHQAIPLDDEETQEEEDSDCVENTKCPVHNRPIEYYCDNDDTLICGRCCITGDHKGHSVTSIEEKNKALAPQLESAAQNGSQILRRLKYSEKKLFGCDPDYSNDCNRLIEDVKSHFRWIHGLLQIREMDIIRDVNNTFAEGATVIQKMRSQLQESQRKVTSLIQAARKVLNDNAVINAQDVLDKLLKANEMPCVLVSKDKPSQPHLRMNWEEKFAADVQSHGSIAGDVETLVSLVPQSEGGSELSDLISESDSMVSSTVDDFSDVIIEEENEESIETASSASRPMSRQSSTDAPRNKPRSGRVTRKSRQLQEVEVTHIKDPSCFMVQLSSEGRELTVLQRNINKWCSNTENQKHRPDTLQPGDLVLGKYTDDETWYRARVKQIFYTVPDKDKPDEKKLERAEVYYFDFGNSEIVPIDRLLKMQNKFMKRGDFAVECCLYDIVHLEGEASWSKEATQTLLQMTTGTKMLMSVIQEVNNKLHVDLCHQPTADIRDDRPVSVRDALVFLELANYFSQSHASVTPPGYTQNRQFLKPEPKHCMENFEAKVCHCNSPESFYLQELGVDARYMADMMAAMEEHYSADTTGIWNILCPEIGMVCAAPLGEKAQWARALVLSLPGQRQVRLQFVDFGNVETVPSLQLKKLLDKFLYLPTFAIHCQLSDVIPIEESGWSPKAYKWCEDNLKDIKCSATVIKAGGEKVHVQLLAVIDDLQYCVNWKLVRDKLAVSTGKTSKIPTNTDASALENNPFLTRRVVRAAADTTSDTSTQSSSKPSGPKVIVKKRPKTDDVSSSSTSSSPVCVEGVEGDTRRRRASQVTDSDSTLPNVNDIHISHLSDSNNSISSSQKESNEEEVREQKRKSTKKKRSSSQSSKTVTKGPTQLEVLITYFESPWKMYIQFKSAAEDGLNQLQKEMQEEFGQTPGVGVLLRPGEYCAAQRHDNKWYRGRIMNVIDSSCVTVFMEDFGFTEVVDTSRMQGLPDKFIKNYRTFALLSHLADITPTGDVTKWSRTAIEFVQQEIGKKKCFVSLKGEKDEKGSQPVDLLIETHIQESALEPASRDYFSLCDRLKQRGLAMPTRRRVKKEQEPLKDCPLQTALAMTAKSPPPSGSQCTSPTSPPVTPLIMLKAPCLYYRPPEVPKETTLQVIPTYVDYGCIIYVHVMGDNHNTDEYLDQLTQSMQQYFSQPPIYSPPDQWLVGQGCAAFYEIDKHWYRAKVIDLPITGDKLRVQYIDFGNSVWVTKDLVRPDIQQFVDVPQQAIECVLHKTEPSPEQHGIWSTPVLETIHDTVVNKNATVYVQEVLENGQLSVSMSLEGITDLSDDLSNKGQAVLIVDFKEHAEISELNAEVLEKKCPYQKCDLPEMGTMFLVLITHLEMPDVVYFQRSRPILEDNSPYAKKVTKDLNHLEKLTVDLNSYSLTALPFEKPKPGAPCLALYGLDNCWYRALMISVREERDQALVVFVDYGNSEFISFEYLKVLPAQFMILPAQAVRCCLRNVAPPGGEMWKIDTLQIMMSEMFNQELIAKITSDIPHTTGVLYTPGASDPSQQQYAYQGFADLGLMTITDEDSQEDDFLIPELNMSPDKRSWAVIVESEEIESLESPEPKEGNSDLMCIDSDSTCTSDNAAGVEDESTGTEGKVSEESEEKEKSTTREVKSSEIEDFEEDDDLGSADWVTTEESDGTVESEV